MRAKISSNGKEVVTKPKEFNIRVIGPPDVVVAKEGDKNRLVAENYFARLEFNLRRGGGVRVFERPSGLFLSYSLGIWLGPLSGPLSLT